LSAPQSRNISRSGRTAFHANNETQIPAHCSGARPCHFGRALVRPNHRRDAAHQSRCGRAVESASHKAIEMRVSERKQVNRCNPIGEHAAKHRFMRVIVIFDTGGGPLDYGVDRDSRLMLTTSHYRKLHAMNISLRDIMPRRRLRAMSESPRRERLGAFLPM
jgi:hypothetical protein